MNAYITRTLNSGLEVLVDAVTGKVTFRTCGWLVRVPSGHPEPDSFADTFMDVECGVRLANHEDLCEAHAATLAAPLNDWDDIPVNPATDLSHIY
jgi:hypothetical protein